jgi:hypothetical protein
MGGNLPPFHDTQGTARKHMYLIWWIPFGRENNDVPQQLVEGVYGHDLHGNARVLKWDISFMYEFMTSRYHIGLMLLPKVGSSQSTCVYAEGP